MIQNPFKSPQEIRDLMVSTRDAEILEKCQTIMHRIENAAKFGKHTVGFERELLTREVKQLLLDAGYEVHTPEHIQPWISWAETKPEKPDA